MIEHLKLLPHGTQVALACLLTRAVKLDELAEDDGIEAGRGYDDCSNESYRGQIIGDLKLVLAGLPALAEPPDLHRHLREVERLEARAAMSPEAIAQENMMQSWWNDVEKLGRRAAELPPYLH